MTTITRITPALLARARQALEDRGLTVQRLKGGTAALGEDPDSAPAYTVRMGRRVVAEDVSARGLVDLAARAAGEDDNVDD